LPHKTGSNIVPPPAGGGGASKIFSLAPPTPKGLIF